MSVDYSKMTTEKLEELSDNYMDLMDDISPNSHTAYFVAGVVKKINTELMKRKRHFQPSYA